MKKKLSGARRKRSTWDVKGRTGAKCCVETGSDLMGKVHTILVHELAPDGNWQVGKAEQNCIDKLCLDRPWAKPLAMLPSHQGKLRRFEISLHLSVDGDTLHPSSTAAKHFDRAFIKILMRKASHNSIFSGSFSNEITKIFSYFYYVLTEKDEGKWHNWVFIRRFHHCGSVKMVLVSKY